MSEHEQYPHDQSADSDPATADANAFEDDEQRSERYYYEAANLYLRHILKDTSETPSFEPTSEARVSFEAAYAGSYEDERAFARFVAIDLGWTRIVHFATRHGGIPEGALVWDPQEILAYASRYFTIFRTPEATLHTFRKPGIAPLRADLMQRGGAEA